MSARDAMLQTDDEAGAMNLMKIQKTKLIQRLVLLLFVLSAVPIQPQPQECMPFDSASFPVSFESGCVGNCQWSCGEAKLFLHKNHEFEFNPEDDCHGFGLIRGYWQKYGSVLLLRSVTKYPKCFCNLGSAYPGEPCETYIPKCRSEFFQEYGKPVVWLVIQGQLRLDAKNRPILSLNGKDPTPVYGKKIVKYEDGVKDLNMECFQPIPKIN